MERETGGAAFGLHRAAGEVVLWKRYGEFSGRADLEAASGEFPGLALEWKGKLSVGNFVAPAADTPHA